MSEEGKPFDANPFEKKQEAEELAEQRETLMTPILLAVVQEGQEPTPITRLDVLSSEWRRMATRLLKAIDPESYAKYKEPVAQTPEQYLTGRTRYSMNTLGGGEGCERGL